MLIWGVLTTANMVRLNSIGTSIMVPTGHPMVRWMAGILGCAHAAVIRSQRLDGSLLLEIIHQVSESVLNGLRRAINLPEDPSRDQDVLREVR